MSTQYAPSVARRAAVGGVAGLLPGVVLAATVDPAVVGVAGPLLGAAYALASGSVGRPVDHALSATALAIPAWALASVTAIPLAVDGGPAWTVAGATARLPDLAGWVLAGTLFGLAFPIAATVAARRFEPVRTRPAPPDPTRIVVVGGGFVGLTVARSLERLFGPDPTVELTLVSDTNATLFTPMLAEVAAGTLEPTHVTSPLRTSLRRTRVIRAAATRVDVDARRVALGDEGRPRPGTGPDGDPDEGEAAAAVRLDGSTGDGVDYDHLVLAVGSVPHYHGVPGVEAFAFDFKTVRDAIRIREHVVDCFERADREPDPERRAALATVVVAGGGFSGAELAGGLNDAVRGFAPHYPNVDPDEVSVVVVHGGDRIVPELSASLSAYALERMADRGVSFVLGERVAAVGPGAVRLASGAELRAGTVVWTAGSRPDPLVGTLGVPTDRGAVVVDETLAVPDAEGVWAAGDCAAVTDATTGERHPPTAQHAVRAARALADNLHATVTGGTPTPFSHQTQGSLAVVGHQVAVAEVFGVRFAGLSAWLCWRAVYLAKLPGVDRQTRVLVDWLVALAFPRDAIQTVNAAVAGDERAADGAATDGGRDRP